MSDRVIRIIIDPRAAEAGGDRAKRAIRSVNGEAQRAETQMMGLARAATFVKSAFYTLVSGAVVRELAKLADTSKNLSAQLLLVEGSTAKVKERQRELVDLSVRTGTALGANVDLYRKVKGALVETYGESGKYLRVTESISKALIISGADANTASGAIRQLGQALGSGAFRGDEFNSVAEAAPRLMKMLGDSLGVPTTKLREMAAEGELTSDKLYKALSDRKFTESLDREFKMMPMTFGRAWENIKSAAIVVFGEFDRGGRFSNSILNFANFGSQDIEKLGDKAYETGKEIEAAFSALGSVFDPMLLGANSVFDQIGVKSLSLRDQIKEALDIIYDVKNAHAHLAHQIAIGAADTADLPANLLTGGRWTPLGDRARASVAQRQKEIEDGRWSTRYEELAEARTAGGLRNRPRGSIRDIRGSAAQIVADRERAKKAAEGTATADAESAKSAKKAADETARREKSLSDGIASLEREAEIARYVGVEREQMEALYRAEEQAGRKLSETEKERIKSAIQLRNLHEAITDNLRQLEDYNPEKAAAAARSNELEDPTSVASKVARIDDKNQAEFEERMRKGARAFRDEGLLAAEAIGQAIGGSAGNALKTVAGVLQGVKSGDYTGVSGPAGGLLTLLSGKSGKNNPFKEGMKEAFDNAAKPFKDVAKEIGKSFGLDGAFTKTLGKAFGGAAVGTATSGVMKALGIKTSQTGAQIGGAIGGITGIPGGEIIGSVLGGVIGGMLKKVKWGAADLTGGDDYGIRGNSAKAKGAAGVAADSFLGGLQSIADALGADLGKYSVTIGQRHGDWRVNTTAGGSLKKKKGAHEFDDDAEGAIKFAIRDAIRDGALLGISAFSERVLKGNTDLDKALDLATKYEQVLDALGADANGITAAAKDFTESFQTLAKEMQKVGATAEELANVEKLYGIEREKAMQSLLAPLLDYQKALSGEGSGVTALERMKAAQVDYEKAKADFAAGKVDQGVVTGAGQQYFGLARDVLGTANSEFQSIRQQLIADSAGLLETARNAFNAGAPDKLVAMQETANTIATQAYQQQVIGNQYLAAIQASLAGIAGGGAGIAGLRFVNGKLMAA
ncbi:MAG: tape measure protein [Pseudomonadota bacterium]|nr:tape measure protein [Pseudomonadota bacterium]